MNSLTNTFVAESPRLTPRAIPLASRAIGLLAPILFIVLTAQAFFRQGLIVWSIGIALSAMLWLIVGAVAARRTTRNPMAGWPDFWRTFFWLAAGIWIGAGVALLVARYAIGEALVG